MTTWVQTRNKIIKRALRIVGGVAQGEDPSADQLFEGSEALNALICELSADGIKLFNRDTIRRQINATSLILGADGYVYQCVRGHKSELSNKVYSGTDSGLFWEKVSPAINYTAWAPSTAYTTGQKVYANNGTTYAVYTANGNHTSAGTFAADISNWTIDNTYPGWVVDTDYYYIGDFILGEDIISVSDVVIHNTTNNCDYPVELIGRDRWLNIYDKRSNATNYPLYVFIDKQIQQRGLIYPIPADTTSYDVRLNVSIMMANLINPSDTPDTPRSYYNMLIYSLADYLSDEYGIPMDERNWINSRAIFLQKKCKKNDKEDTTSDTVASAYRPNK